MLEANKSTHVQKEGAVKIFATKGSQRKGTEPILRHIRLIIAFIPNIVFLERRKLKRTCCPNTAVHELDLCRLKFTTEKYCDLKVNVNITGYS